MGIDHIRWWNQPLPQRPWNPNIASNQMHSLKPSPLPTDAWSLFWSSCLTAFWSSLQVGLTTLVSPLKRLKWDACLFISTLVFLITSRDRPRYRTNFFGSNSFLHWLVNQPLFSSSFIFQSLNSWVSVVVELASVSCRTSLLSERQRWFFRFYSGKAASAV